MYFINNNIEALKVSPKKLKVKQSKEVTELKTVIDLLENKESLQNDGDEPYLLYKQLLKELPYVKEQRRREIGIEHLFLLEFMTHYLICIVNLRSKIWSQLNEDTKLRISLKINLLIRSLKIRDKKISKSETEDFDLEMKRISRFGDLFILESSSEFKDLRTNEKIQNIFKVAEDLVSQFCSFTEKHAKIVDEAILVLKDTIKSSAQLTAKDLKMIHSAMSSSFYSGSAQGHWFKCPNGHIYVITECGGAMETARCPEKGCGAMIGGSNHRYLPNQQLASEMDGATRPAWSTGNDIGNFDLNNIR